MTTRVPTPTIALWKRVGSGEGGTVVARFDTVAA